MANRDPKLSANDITSTETGKVGLKGILKGGSAQALRPAAMEGFRVADFHRDTHATQRPEDQLQAEVRRLENQLAQSKSEIAKLNDRLLKETKAAQSSGYQEGHFKGLAEGEKNAEDIWQAQIKVIRQDVAETLDNIALQHRQLFGALQDTCVELALGIAERVFCAEAECSQTLIHQVIAESFQYLGQEERLRIRINPLDLALSEKGESFWRPLAGNVQSIELVPDPRIERGGCLVEAEKGGSIDMRTQTLFANLAEAVRTAYAQIKSNPPLETPSDSQA
jgi:flagellar assembly protein FliH